MTRYSRLWATLLAVAVAGCGENAPPTAAKGGKLNVLCSFFPIYVFTKNVVGDRPNVAVDLMVPAKMGCPHDYDLKPGDVKKLLAANVFLMNGSNLEEFTEADIRKHNPNIVVVNTSAKLSAKPHDHDHDHHHDHGDHKHEKALSAKAGKKDDHDHDHGDHKHEKAPSAKAGKKDDHDHDHGDHKHEKAPPAKAGKKDDHDHDHAQHKHEKDGHDHGHDHGGVNPHFFSSPCQAAVQVEAIGEALAKADPDGATHYRSRAKAYAQKLRDLGEQFHETKFANNKIVTVHEVFDYLAEECDLEIVATIHATPGREPSAPEMRKLVDTIKAKKAAAIFTEPQFEGQAPQTIAKDVGIPHYQLDPVASGPDDASLDYYELKMQENLATLKKALAGAGH